MDFKNPWGKGSSNYDKWMKNNWGVNKWSQGGKYYEASSISEVNQSTLIEEQTASVPDYIILWLDSVGYTMFTTFTEKYGYSDIGAFLEIGQANKEKGWGEIPANKSAWDSNNWWNVAPRESKGEVACANSRWTCFQTLQIAMDHYNDWMTSTPNLDATDNSTFNPSFPEFGILLKSEEIASENQITSALRLGDQFPYCVGDDTYASEVILLQQRASRDMAEYLSQKIGKTQVSCNTLGIQITKAVSEAHKPMTLDEKENIDDLEERWRRLTASIEKMKKDLIRVQTARDQLND